MAPRASLGYGKVYDTDPESGWFRRAIIQIGTWLPIDWLLWIAWIDRRDGREPS